ncbi:MAG: response regulator [Dehalococcoidales bacterium]|nr:response regulator [Dehalococcoidales bacterium]
MSKKVLVIDTTASNWTGYMPLSKEGYSVDSANDVNTGMQKLNDKVHDAIIIYEKTDAQSWQVCERIRRLSRMPLIVISPNATAETSVKALGAGADYFMRKPFYPLELLARVDCLLRRASLYQHKTSNMEVLSAIT